jgi:hypothetical protein
VNVCVHTNARNLLGGHFDGMSIEGHRWQTPMQMTAEQMQARHCTGMQCSMYAPSSAASTGMLQKHLALQAVMACFS